MRNKEKGITINSILKNHIKLLITEIDYGEAIGHTSSFLQAASNTTQVTLSHTLHRLALHKDVQEKVREEVESIIQSGQKQIQYDDTLKMTYLHNVIRGKLVTSVVKKVRCNISLILPQKTNQR